MAEANSNPRLEAFCDGVFAIAITLLIIEVKIPTPHEVNNTAEFWSALRHAGPSIFAFVLSFTIILITWVNHYYFLKLIKGSSSSFIYANGLLLLTVVFMPFPTALIGEHIFTDHSAPAVILYNANIVVQSVGWILVCNTALGSNLNKSENAAKEIRKSRKYGFFSCGVYVLFSTLAFWFPIPVAIVTVLLWVVWLIVGIRIKHQD